MIRGSQHAVSATVHALPQSRIPWTGAVFPRVCKGALNHGSFV